jgi:tetrahydromethanopterin S-methyltransferase subunit H
MRIHVAVVLMLMMTGRVFAAGPNAAEAGSNAPLRAAVFVQNRAGNEFQEKIDGFRDLITARLTAKGFAVIDKNDVVAKFQESRTDDGAIRNVIKAATDLTRAVKTEAPVEDIITDASALRMAQMLGADYLVFATITSFGQEQKTFKGQGTVYGTDNAVTDHIMHMTLKVCEGVRGSTVYGDVVNATERIPQTQNLEINSTEITNKLFNAGALQLADNVSKKIEDIRAVKLDKGAVVDFSVSSNVQGATVELDGAAIGAAPGKFQASEGLHQMRVSKERYATWEKTVNIHAGQALNVTLDLSSEGIQRADAVSETENKKMIAEGEKAMLDKSYVRDDGIGHEIKAIVHEGGMK